MSVIDHVTCAQMLQGPQGPNGRVGEMGPKGPNVSDPHLHLI